MSLFNIQTPIIQAPMAGSTTAELVAAVSNSGGLGSLGAAYLEPEALRKAIQSIKRLTDRPFAVNLFAPENAETTQAAQVSMCNILNDVCAELSVDVKPVDPPYCPDFDEQFTVIIEEGVPIFSFTFGIPDANYLNQLRQNNTVLIGTATSVNEALALQAANVDAIVAQGIEAGGHRGTFSGNPVVHESVISLLSECVKQIDLPVIAAGGIADVDSMNNVLSLGASAVQMGTVFLTTHESSAHALHKKVLLELNEDKTELTRAFSGRWARSVNNQFVERMKDYETDILPFPIQNKLTQQVRLLAAKQSNPEFMSLWAGQSAHRCRDVSVAELMREFIAVF